MALARALTLQSGRYTQVQDGDTLQVGLAIDRATAGALAIGGTTATTLSLGRATQNVELLGLVGSVANPNVVLDGTTSHSFYVADAAAGNGGALTVSSGNAPAAAGNGGSSYLYAGGGASAGIGTGGNVIVAAGEGGATSGVGGAINISSGIGTNDASGVTILRTANGATDSGNLSIYTGNAAGGNSGTISLLPGTATGTRGTIDLGDATTTVNAPGTLVVGTLSTTNLELINAGGTNYMRVAAGALANLEVYSANATGATASGYLTLRSGTTTNGASGAVTLQSGNATAGASGQVNIISGTSSSTASGNIAINVGAGTGSNGSIGIGNGASAPAAITIGQAATPLGVASAATFSAAGTALTVNNNATVTGTLTNTGGIYANGGVDRSGAATLTIAGTNATGVDIAAAGAAATSLNLGTTANMTALAIGTGMGVGDTITLGGAGSALAINSTVSTAISTSNGGFENAVGAATMNIGTNANPTTVNLATGANVATLNIGTGMGAGDNIVVGGAGDAIHLVGTTTIDTLVLANLELTNTAGVHYMRIAAGNAASSLEVYSANTTAAASGAITLKSGNALGGVSGAVNITSGTSDTGASGDVNIDSGVGTGSNGVINVGTANANIITVGARTIPSEIRVAAVLHVTDHNYLGAWGPGQFAFEVDGTANAGNVRTMGYVNAMSGFGHGGSIPAILSVGCDAMTQQLDLGVGASVNDVEIGTNAATTAINIGTGQTLPAHTINIGGGGAGGSLTTIGGDLQVTGNLTVLGTSEFTGDVVFDNNVGIGDAVAPTPDMLYFHATGGRFGGDGVGARSLDVLWVKELNHQFYVDASTTAGAAGGNLSVYAGAGGAASGGAAGVGGGLGLYSGLGGAADAANPGGKSGNIALNPPPGGAGSATAAAGGGGDVTIKGGGAGADGGGGGASGGSVTIRGGNKSGAGSYGTVLIGDSNTLTLELGAAACPTNVNGDLTVDGNTTLGNAGTDTLTVYPYYANHMAYTNIVIGGPFGTFASAGVTVNDAASGGNPTAVTLLGKSGAASVAGGGVLLNSGAGGTEASGGAVFFLGGAGGAAGAAAVGGDGGSFIGLTGAGGAASATFAGGKGGGLLLVGNNGGAASAAQPAGAGGKFEMSAGDAGSNAAGGGGANGGDFVINAGDPSGAGTAGSITIGATKSYNITIGRVGMNALTLRGGTAATSVQITAGGTPVVLLASTVVGGDYTISTLHINGSGIGATVTGNNLNTLTNNSDATGLHYHSSGGAASQVVVNGLTTALADGDFAYVSGAMTLSKTDATNMSTSVCMGASEGTANTATVAGVIENAKFTTADGSPANGAAVYLALAATDGGTGAGKLRATAPSAVGQVVAEVGICLDNSNYAALKTCKVLLQVKSPIQL